LLCGSSWDEASVDQLVRYIRALAEDDQGVAA
jgi:hypothetical protein